MKEKERNEKEISDGPINRMKLTASVQELKESEESRAEEKNMSSIAMCTNTDKHKYKYRQNKIILGINKCARCEKPS